MELKEGYKQTDIGMIPNDWEVQNFGNIVNYIKGFPFKSKDYRQDGIRIIRVSDTTFDSIKKDNAIYVDENRSNEYRNWKLEEYDLIFSTVGSKPPMYDSMVGKVILIKKVNVGSLLNQNAVLIRAKNKTKYIQTLLLSHFKTKRYLQHIEEIFRGNANQASITLEDLFKYKIPLPPTLSEQTAIARALSDADALITSLDKLIAKKRYIKQGAMQVLLKPKEGWEVKKLGEIADCFSGGTPSTFNANYWNGSIIWLPSGRVQNNILQKQENEITITKLGLDESSAKLIKENSVLIAITGATCGNIGLLNFSAAANQSVIAIEPNEQAEYRFLYYLLLMKRNKILSYQTGSAQGGVNLKAIKNLKISFPMPKEQTHIASSLYDMDAEIEALENKLEKAKMLKQGMMQELLTGRIRLI